ncbi:hypothetical protein JOQ06_012245, partial [Pogonophryne albipinna]
TGRQGCLGSLFLPRYERSVNGLQPSGFTAEVRGQLLSQSDHLSRMTIHNHTHLMDTQTHRAPDPVDHHSPCSPCGEPEARGVFTVRSHRAYSYHHSVCSSNRLALYVYEYLLHVGAQKSAQTFLSEIRWEKNITLGEPPGFLHSWWCVFWDLYCAAPERRDSCEHSSEAKAFHDYSAAAAPSPVLGSLPPGEGMPVGPVPPGFFQTGLDMYWLKQGDTSGTAGCESLAA